MQHNYSKPSDEINSCWEYSQPSTKSCVLMYILYIYWHQLDEKHALTNRRLLIQMMINLQVTLIIHLHITVCKYQFATLKTVKSILYFVQENFLKFKKKVKYVFKIWLKYCRYGVKHLFIVSNFYTEAQIFESLINNTQRVK